MWTRFPLFPEAASTVAGGVDILFLFMVGVSIVFSALIFGSIFYFALRYFRRSAEEIPKPIHGSMTLELVWSIIPFLLTMVMFVWGTVTFFRNYDPPDGAMEIYVTGKQWMWKIQHPEGHREINELHVPVGKPVKLTMATEDVIHSFYVPAFRVKKDVVPGMYTTMWFQPTKPGKYHLFCAEYCGNQHSGMTGWVYVMEQAEYEKWLSSSAKTESMAQAGQRLFIRYKCGSCHRGEGGRGPAMEGVFGSTVALEGGGQVLADSTYLRESILRPGAKSVRGFTAVHMPTFQGQMSEEELIQIIAYIRTLATKPPAQGPDGDADEDDALKGAPKAAQPASSGAGAMVAAGEKLFVELKCNGCHEPFAAIDGPELEGIYNTRVELKDGSRVLINDAYLKESIVNPDAKIVKEFSGGGMPPPRRPITPVELDQLVAYIKSLGKPGGSK